MNDSTFVLSSELWFFNEKLIYAIGGLKESDYFLVWVRSEKLCEVLDMLIDFGHKKDLIATYAETKSTTKFFFCFINNVKI